MIRQLPRSIAGRLVMLYALTSSAILLLSGVLMYGTMSLHLTREKTQFLSDEIRTLRMRTGGVGVVGAIRDAVLYAAAPRD